MAQQLRQPTRHHASTPQDVHYIAFVRLPFARGDFVDPPLVDWDSVKDQALWNILSQNPRSTIINWSELAQRFEVTLPFILQQAAWLYERQLSQVREQMRKISRSQAVSPSQGLDVPTSPSAQDLQRQGSRDSPGQLLPFPKGSFSSLNAQTISARNPELRDRPRFKGNEVSVSPTTAAKPPITRTASTNTITQSQIISRTSLLLQTKNVNRISLPTTSTNETAPAAVPADFSQRRESSQSPANSDSESDSSSSSERDSRRQNLKSQILRRTPRFANSKGARARGPDDDSADEDDDDAPAFLTHAGASDENYTSMGDTLRSPEQQQLSRATSTASEIQSHESISSAASSGSSAMPLSARATSVNPDRPPRVSLGGHRTELVGNSPHARGVGRQASEGTPSMGSSFSDLDDSSVTQSALEEALLSNLQRGGMGSRISNISQASRSRLA